MAGALTQCLITCKKSKGLNFWHSALFSKQVKIKISFLDGKLQFLFCLQVCPVESILAVALGHFSIGSAPILTHRKLNVSCSTLFSKFKFKIPVLGMVA